MDFLKTLMLYMSLTFATSVQSTVPPQETPVPTFTPVPAVVEVVPEGTQAVSGDVTPAPAAAATAAPEATITPNRAYSNLKMNSRGEKVKKLQQRLIELGYLSQGDDDGVYGRQTYNAVKAFQKANGLGADGIAGDATQTHLFENPSAAPNPDMTAVPQPTATPGPTQAPTAEPTAEPTIVPPESEPEAAVPTAEPTSAPVASPAMTAAVGVSVVLNDSGEKLTYLQQQDGVTVRVEPRLWLDAEDRLYLDLIDLAACTEDWSFTMSMDGTYQLLAEGYEVLIAADGLACTVEGETIPLTEEDFLLYEASPLCGPTLLEKALGAETLWDADEKTLMLQIVHRDVAKATD